MSAGRSVAIRRWAQEQPSRELRNKMNPLRLVAIGACCITPLLASAASPEYHVDSAGSEQLSKDVVVVQLREDSFMGSPDDPAAPAHSSRKVESIEGVVSKGIYSSPYQGYQIRIPKVAENPKVSVHQALISKRPDGTPITSHVLFIPEGGYGAAAVVVTRLRDDRPKDAASILSRFEPKTPAEYTAYEERGVIFQKLNGALGPAVQRAIRNRAFSWHFPYRVAVDPAHPKGTVGVSRYVVVGEFLCEFSVIVDGSKAPSTEALQAVAARELDVLMGAMVRKPQ
jgi:hypothetical protein